MFGERNVVSAEQFQQAVNTFHYPSFDQDYGMKWLRFILSNISLK